MMNGATAIPFARGGHGSRRPRVGTAEWPNDHAHRTGGNRWSGGVIVPLRRSGDGEDLLRLDKPDGIEPCHRQERQSLPFAAPDIDIHLLAKVIDEFVLAGFWRCFSGPVSHGGQSALLYP